MSLNAVQLDPDVISKGEFARRRGVSPGRVSQWIAEGKITSAALVGAGRTAQLRESVALAELRARLDPMQMTANGLSTKLKPAAASSLAPVSADVLPFGPLPAAGATAPPPPPPSEAADPIEEQIKRQRLAQLERQNREGERQEAVEAGRLTDAAAAKAAAARETSRLVTMFEGSLSNFATAISAEFKLPQRDVLHLLRGEFRKLRAGVASEIRAKADALPALVDIDAGELAAAETESA